jgi:hypothetical protein
MLAHVGAYSAYATPPCEIAALRFVDLVQIQILRLVNHFARLDRRSRIAIRIQRERPRRGRNDQRHRKNRPEDTFDCMWLKCHDSPPDCAAGDLGGVREEMCELLHTSLVCPKNAWTRRASKK